MKIGDTRPVRGATGAYARSEKLAPSDTVAVPRQIEDTASIMGIPEIELTPKVRAAIMTLMEEVGRLRQELEQANKRLGDIERLADQDTLVPIANRRAFVRELSRILSYTERYSTPASLVYFDINNFKEINDTHGHAAGDAALGIVAKRLTHHIRESDVVGRLGGDEFGVILVHADEAVATEKANSLAEAIAEGGFEWDSQRLDLDVAFGVYAFQPGVDVSQALAEADKAMYANKNASRTDVR